MLLAISCASKSGNDKILAKVGDKYLYATDIEGYNTGSDSTEFVKKFVANWINNQILIQHAQKNTGESTEEIDQKVEKLRQDLYLAEYEKDFIRKNLDTTVTKNQITEFYNANKPLFELRDYVVNVFYMKFDISEKNNSKIGNDIRNCKNASEAKKIEEKYSSLSVNSYLEPNAWIFFSDLMREVPITVDDKARFLELNNFYETKTEEDIYFVRIFDYKLKNETSPVNIVENKIKSLILRDRSQKLISTNRNNIIKQFNKENEVQNYTK